MTSFTPDDQRRTFGSSGQHQGCCGRRQKYGLPPSCITAASAMICAFCLISTPAFAEKGEKSQSVPGEAINAAAQPLEDLNIRSRKIPDLLAAIDGNPYAIEDMEDCTSLRGSINRLDDVLGPDADEETKNGSVVNKALRAGGNVLGGFIPFRGLMREVSGANSQRRKMEVAIYNGVARRSFLKGYATAMQCKSVEEITVQSAEDVLGLSGRSALVPDNDRIDPHEYGGNETSPPE